MKWTDKDFDNLYEDLVQYFDGNADEVTEFMASGEVEPYLEKFHIDLMEPEEAHDETCDQLGVDPGVMDRYLELEADATVAAAVAKGK